MLKLITGSITMSLNGGNPTDSKILGVFGFLFFLLVCFVVFDEIKRRRIKELEDSLEVEKAINETQRIENSIELKGGI